MLSIRQHRSNRSSRSSRSLSSSSSNTKVNVPKRTFPLIQDIYTELNTQVNENKANLTVSKKKLKQLKTIIDQIEGNSKTFPIHVILYLIQKIQNAPAKKQPLIIDIILNIFNKFILIENCLIQQNITDSTIFYELDKQFDRCIDHFIRVNIIYIQDIKNYIDQIDTEITFFLESKSIDITKFKQCNKSIVVYSQNGLFNKIRNGFLLFCSKFNISMRPELHTLFNILQYCGDTICSNITSIDIVLKIFSVMYEYSDSNIKHIKNVLELYCAVNKDIKKDKLLNSLLEQLKNKKEVPKTQKENLLDFYKENGEYKTPDSSKNNEPEQKPPAKKEYFSRYSNPLTRTLNTQITKMEEFISDKIKKLNLDNDTTNMLLSTVIIVRKSVQIEGWHSFIASFNKHSRLLLGEKIPGRKPETPFQKIINGKLYIRLNRSTFLSNIVVVMPFFYYSLTNKLQKYLE
jgi:hypothetical protein